MCFVKTVDFNSSLTLFGSGCFDLLGVGGDGGGGWWLGDLHYYEYRGVGGWQAPSTYIFKNISGPLKSKGLMGFNLLGRTFSRWRVQKSSVQCNLCNTRISGSSTRNILVDPQWPNSELKF